MGEARHQRKIMMQFEVHGEDESGPLKTDNDEPMSISKNYTLSLGEKAGLRHDLQAWRSREFTEEELKGFNLKNVLGAWCMLTVTKERGRDGKEYTNISGISPVPKALKTSLPEPHNDLAIFSLDAPDFALFESLSDRIKAKIEASPEWKGLSKPKANTPNFHDISDEEIPF
jgi:hypothetical protein